jgi:hypothetical protein
MFAQGPSFFSDRWSLPGHTASRRRRGDQSRHMEAAQSAGHPAATPARLRGIPEGIPSADRTRADARLSRAFSAVMAPSLSAINSIS